MTTPRRRIVRPTPDPSAQERQRQAQKLRTRLDRERVILARWMSRLKRAFHAVEKAQLKVTRIERQLARLENTPCSNG